MTVEPAAPPAPSRRGGLIFFGIVLLLLGICAGLAALLTSLVAFMPQHAGAPPMPRRMIAGVAPFYAGIAVMLATLGIGSMMARRWARALTLAVSWIWLVSGVLSVISFFAMSRFMFASLPPDAESAKPIMLGCMVIIFGVFGVLVPLCYVLFYRSRRVIATVETLDTVARWTDRVPMPVLAFGVLSVWGACSLLMFSIFYPSFPFGQTIVSGIAVPATFIAIATALFFIGIGTFRLQPAAWWAAVILLLAGVAYGVVMVPRTDFVGWAESQLPSTTPAQTEMLRAFYSGPVFFGWLIAAWVVYGAYLLFIRRYFFRPETRR
jgi:hypothetical protein